MNFQEKDLLWKVREHCLIRLPHLLPRIIDCVDYGRPEEIVELHRLIDRWPLMPVEHSLQVGTKYLLQQKLGYCILTG